MATGRVLRIAWRALLWLVVVLAALSLGEAGWGKFEHAEGWQHWFGRWGYPPWFAQVIGVVELGGAVLLLIPRTSSYAAATLIGVMLGAFYTVMTNETDLGWVDPLVNIALLSIVAAGQWRRRWRRRKAAP